MMFRAHRVRMAVVWLVGGSVLASVGNTAPAHAAELALLSKQNWTKLAPKGKEADAIFGDFVMRNDRVTVVVGFPGDRRNATFATTGVGGAIIDLELRDAPSDQLTAFYPGGGGLTFEFAGAAAGKAAPRGAPGALAAVRRGDVRGVSVSLAFVARPDQHGPEVELVYTLTDGDPFVDVATTYKDLDDQPLDVEPIDRVRVDTNRDLAAIDRSPDGPTGLFWAYDRWFGQAYGIVADTPTWTARETTWRAPTVLSYGVHVGEKRSVTKGLPLRLRRRLIVGRDLLAVRATANLLAEVAQRPVRLTVSDGLSAAGGAAAKKPVEGADVAILIRDQIYGLGRTDERGEQRFFLPRDVDAVAVVSTAGQRERRILLAMESERFQVTLETPGWIEIDVREEGKPVPCKVQLFGRFGTHDPNFGPDHLESWLGNLVYAAGAPGPPERHRLAPGRYDAIVSHGPEYDAVFMSVEVLPGVVAPLRAELKRTVDTTGWISADFHNHSTESGDNITSQRGRVRALLAEQLEFAPCTEHNRVSSYVPDLEALGALGRMATASGIELTGSEFAINHQNAFPLVMHAHTQDNGGPEASSDMDLQIERLALWDHNSEKLVQENHPSLSELFFDVDHNDVVDRGHVQALGFIDVVEVHPVEAIFWTPLSDQYPPSEVAGAPYDNRILSWLQILNRGHRLPAVVNTDAHGNFHETGWLRNFVRSPTDDPARIKTLDVVREAEKGHVIVSNGPFLEVSMSPPDAAVAAALPGDEIKLPGGRGVLHVRVQTPNWLDVDHVRVLVNGRPDRALDFTRAKNPGMFGAGVVKFEHDLSIALKTDAHVIVAVTNQHGRLGPVMGPDHADDRPVAFSNPIFVDVDGGGFRPNGDQLDSPMLPLKKRPRPPQR
jgi:hypothetical protein